MAPIVVYSLIYQSSVAEYIWNSPHTSGIPAYSHQALAGLDQPFESPLASISSVISIVWIWIKIEHLGHILDTLDLLYAYQNISWLIMVVSS